MTFPVSTGDIITAAQWNAKGGYVDWTPNQQFWSLGNGTVSGRYTQTGKLIIAHGKIVLGSTSTISAGFSTNFPVTPASFHSGPTDLGWVLYTDAGANQYPGTIRFSSSTRARFHAHRADQTMAIEVAADSTTPFTFGNSDQIHWTMIYEAA